MISDQARQHRGFDAMHRGLGHLDSARIEAGLTGCKHLDAVMDAGRQHPRQIGSSMPQRRLLIRNQGHSVTDQQNRYDVLIGQRRQSSVNPLAC